MVAGALVLAACRTPGEGLQQDSVVTDSGASSNTSAGTPNATASATTGGTSGGTDAVASSDGASVGTSAGDPTGGATATTDSVGGTSSGSGGGATSAATTEANTTSQTSGTTGGTNASNLIDNGDFETDSATCEIDENDWFTEGAFNWSGVDDTICSYCIVLDPDQSGQLNWSGNAGTPPTLEGGQSYRFSFDVYSNEGATPTLTAKVGQPVDPYAAFLEEVVSVPSSSATQSYTFTMDNTDQAGIAFFVSVGSEWGKICFDNIAIEPL